MAEALEKPFGTHSYMPLPRSITSIKDVMRRINASELAGLSETKTNLSKTKLRSSINLESPSPFLLKDARTIFTVSYTHLDVYKRQDGK